MGPQIYPQKGRVTLSVDPDSRLDLPGFEVTFVVEPVKNSRKVVMGYLCPLIEDTTPTEAYEFKDEKVVIYFNKDGELAELRMLEWVSGAWGGPGTLENKVDAFVEEQDSDVLASAIALLVGGWSSIEMVMEQTEMIQRQVENFLDGLDGEADQSGSFEAEN